MATMHRCHGRGAGGADPVPAALEAAIGGLPEGSEVLWPAAPGCALVAAPGAGLVVVAADAAAEAAGRDAAAALARALEGWAPGPAPRVACVGLAGGGGAEAVARAAAEAGAAGAGLPERPAAFRRVVRDGLLPALGWAAHLDDAWARGGAAWVRLDEGQRAAVAALAGAPRGALEGPAGSGRTLVSLEVARRAAAGGAGVLWVCAGRDLARVVEARVTAAASAGGLDVMCFQALANAAFRALRRPFRLPQGATEERERRFWQEEAPAVVAEAAAAGRLPRWEAVVVDQGEAFPAAWWGALEAAAAEGAAYVATVDAGQRPPDVEGACPWPAVAGLGRSYRPPAAVAAWAGAAAGGALEAVDGGGAAVEVLTPATEAEAIEAVEGAVRRLLAGGGVAAGEIAVLTPGPQEASSLAGVAALAGVALTADPLRREGRLVVAPLGRFAGLDARAVVAVDLPEPGAGAWATWWAWQAATRARERLVVVRPPAGARVATPAEAA